MKAFQNDLSRFEAFNAQVLGVSADNLDTHRAYAQKLGLEFPLLVDDGSLRKQYGGGRITFLIDQGGTIRAIQKGMPDIAALLGRLKALN